MTSSLPVAIIGGGPAGLAAAAHLVQYKQAFVLFESGPALGTHFLEYGHVQLFSAWRYNIDAASKKLFELHGLALPDPEHLPYGKEIAEQYLQPLGELPELKPFIHLNSRVVHLQRQGLDKMKTADREEKPFELVIENGTGTRKLYAHEQSSMRPAPGKTPTLLYPAVRLMQQPNSSITAFQRFLAQTKNALKTSGWQWSEAAIRR